MCVRLMYAYEPATVVAINTVLKERNASLITCVQETRRHKQLEELTEEQSSGKFDAANEH